MRGKILGLVLAVMVVVVLVQASSAFACLVNIGGHCISLGNHAVSQSVNPLGIAGNPRCGGGAGPAVGPGAR